MKFIDREPPTTGILKKGYLMREAKRASRFIEGPGTIGYKESRKVMN